MGRYRRKKMHVNDKAQRKKYRTKRRTKDLDQIQDDMSLGNAYNLTHQPIDDDLPGQGQHYCLHCARYFIDQETLIKHFKSKLHKRRMSALKEPVYTRKEAEMAAGIGSYVLPAAPLERDMKSAVDDDGRTEVKAKRKKDKNSNEILSLNNLLKSLEV